MSSRSFPHQYVGYMIFTIIQESHILLFSNHHSILINGRKHLFCVAERHGDTCLVLIYDSHISLGKQNVLDVVHCKNPFTLLLLLLLLL